ncbi:HAD family hydrolase [Mongoliibacter ruber]|uniref:Putative hydrolase of the HAD superfamily n=1 Tax=Mongoliibacter ruber TaxID=1750599 RepID=A0A2T0WVQ0_9BACT|nr:HAD family phosphatase [Mongoliibacter ruber]PRY90765.1 putative hydrolase of the HAD superfamily [Mongoliibacter ruber]
MKKLDKIDFLIFDLGNVIIDIDYDVSINELKKILPSKKHHLTSQFFPSSFHKEYEKGLISNEEFRNAVRDLYEENWSDDQIDHVWNSLLIVVPQERLQLLSQLRQQYTTAILSNTNDIHIVKFNEMLQEISDYSSIHNLCDHVFLSHEMGLAKPDTAIYQKVVTSLNTQAEKTIFFDDLAANVEGAKKIGMNAVQITNSKALMEFFGDVQ